MRLRRGLWVEKLDQAGAVAKLLLCRGCSLPCCRRPAVNRGSGTSSCPSCNDGGIGVRLWYDDDAVGLTKYAEAVAEAIQGREEIALWPSRLPDSSRSPGSSLSERRRARIGRGSQQPRRTAGSWPVQLAAGDRRLAAGADPRAGRQPRSILPARVPVGLQQTHDLRPAELARQFTADDRSAINHVGVTAEDPAAESAGLDALGVPVCMHARLGDAQFFWHDATEAFGYCIELITAGPGA